MVEYYERLSPSPVYWLLTLLAAVFAAAALTPVSVVLASAAGLGAAVATGVLLGRSASTLTVSAGELRVGAAHVPVSLVARVDVLDREQTRHALGPGLDARAFVLTRPWVSTAVRVHLDDPADPAPYWVVVTRRPAQLAAAILGRRASGQAAHSEQTS
jgi:sugar (pentulose or hexulose) kinase